MLWLDVSSAPLSWMLVCAYLLVGIFTTIKAFTLYHKKDQLGKHKSYVFWLVLTLYLIFLAYTRHFHVHDSIYNYIREWSLQRGWYEMRRPFQSALLVAIFLSVGGLIAYYSMTPPKSKGNLVLNYLGVGILSLIWILKTISLHYTDALIHIDLGLISVSSIIELMGLVFIVVAASKPAHAH